jgi:hypothetical protein
MIFLGGLIGLGIGVGLSLVIAAVLGVTVTGILGSLAATSDPLLALLASLLALSAGSLIIVSLFTFFMVYFIAYVIATLSLLPLIAAAPMTPPPLAPLPLPPSPVELVMRGLMIGVTAGSNFGIWSLIPIPGPFIGLYVGILGFLTVFPPISRNGIHQGFLGWSSWLMPMSYLATAVGFVLFVINLPFAVAAFGLGAVRPDFLTGTIETTGGAVIGVTGFSGGFNLGNFTFITPGPPAGLAFGAPSLSAHETGHTLNVAAFSAAFHWINAIDENPPITRRTLAYGELTAESHFPRAILTLPSGLVLRRLHVRVWS